MDFLRRILGLASNSSATTPKDDIIITHDATEPITPPEPMIETPARTVEASGEKRREASTDVVTTENSPFTVAKADAVGTRPLPPLEKYIPAPGQRLALGQLSDVGMVRGNNQDAMFSMLSSSASSDDLPDFGLFIVADGMGGHHDGEKAAAITIRTVAQYVLEDIFSSLLNQQMNDPARPAIAEVLRAAVQKANETVTEEIPEGGTTVTTTIILGDLAYIAHVGDSRAYLITGTDIEQITRDHSLVQRLIELDQLTPEEAAEHPQRNVLYRAIGQNDTLDVDAITRQLSPRSRLLLCSDGLWNMVPEDIILDVVSKYSNPQHACDTLVEMANERGGPDNITVILVQVPG
jgi:serine/threonine protein phosphatase PrpC